MLPRLEKLLLVLLPYFYSTANQAELMSCATAWLDLTSQSSFTVTNDMTTAVCILTDISSRSLCQLFTHHFSFKCCLILFYGV